MSSHSSARTSQPVDPLCPRHSGLDLVLVRVAAGDREAFGTLYDEMSQTVYRMSLSGGHEPSRAAAITLDVFICAWLQAGAYDPRVESAWAWVRAIASTTIAAQTRSLHLNPVVSPGTPDTSAEETVSAHV